VIFLRRLLADVEQRHPALRGMLFKHATMATLWHFPQKITSSDFRCVSYLLRSSLGIVAHDATAQIRLAIVWD
jgi:hypothetical protein